MQGRKLPPAAQPERYLAGCGFPLADDRLIGHEPGVADAAAQAATFGACDLYAQPPLFGEAGERGCMWRLAIGYR